MRHIQMKYSAVTIAILVAFILGVCLKPSTKPRIAVVNIEEVLQNYAKFSVTRQENEQKLQELVRWIEGINKEIDEEKDQTKRSKLADQYRKLTQEKEKLIQQEYAKKFQEINEEITSLIDNVAKQNDYNYVFANTSMVSGGKDITSDVIKALK